MPFEDNYADEIRAIHIIEHCRVWKAPKVIKEWVRILKPGGQLAIECPDINKVKALMEVPEIPPNMTFWALYGDPRHESDEMMHRWCYSDGQLMRLMGAAGLVGLKKEPALFHHPVRDMRCVGYKPVPESTLALVDAQGNPVK